MLITRRGTFGRFRLPQNVRPVGRKMGGRYPHPLHPQGRFAFGDFVFRQACAIPVGLSLAVCACRCLRALWGAFLGGGYPPPLLPLGRFAFGDLVFKGACAVPLGLGLVVFPGRGGQRLKKSIRQSSKLPRFSSRSLLRCSAVGLSMFANSCQLAFSISCVNVSFLMAFVVFVVFAMLFILNLLCFTWNLFSCYKGTKKY